MKKTDIHADLRRLAARARRAALKEHPKGATVYWQYLHHSYSGVVRTARHDDVTGEVVLVVDRDDVEDGVMVVRLGAARHAGDRGYPVKKTDKTECYDDVRYCGHCDQDTPQRCRDDDHERDSSNDYQECVICGWWLTGLRREWSPPHKLEPEGDDR